MQRWLLLAAMGVALSGAGPAPRPEPEVFRISVDSTGLRVLVRHLAPTRRGVGTGRAPVLFVHGASFPSALAAAYRFDGVSWMDDLAAKGFDVWAFDFLGYGGSDRYPEMRQPPLAHPPLGRSEPAARQIGAAVEFIARKRGVPRVSIVAHSWGTIPAGRYAGDHPERMARLVQFGPVAQRNEPADTTTPPAYQFVSQEAQRARFYGYVPRGEPPAMAPRHFAAWGPAYLATDSSSSTRVPASVEVPNGPGADADDAWSGHLPYDPAKITAPVLIIRGEWDIVTEDADARWLYDALTHAPIKRDVKISRATHVMHLEAGRVQLYREVSSFLAEDDGAPTRPSDVTARWIHLGAFGTLSGPVQSFGRNSWAALRAATDSVNQAGGVRLGDGATGYLRVSYADDHCVPADGIKLLRELAASDALVAIAPSCAAVAAGVLIPTSFVPVTPAARAAAAAVRRTGGVPDLHSMAAWEIVQTLKRVIEQEKIVGRPETLAADRRKLRDGLARLRTMDGLLGPIERTPDRESRKPFVIVQARQGAWRVVDDATAPPPRLSRSDRRRAR